MEAKCHTVLTALTKLIMQVYAIFYAIFLVGIRIAFLLLEDTSAYRLDDGFAQTVFISGNLLMIAIDISLLYGILNSKNEMVMYCLIYNHMNNFLTLLCLSLSESSWTFFPNLRFSSSLCVLMLGHSMATSSMALLTMATILEFLRLSLLTLAHMGLSILNTPYQHTLPLWTPQQKDQIEEANGQKNFRGQACSDDGDYAQIH